jgi:hypothetical protein
MMTDAYYLHIGATTLPRQAGQPLALAQAMRRATGELYATVYRFLGDEPVPIIAAAGEDQILFVPTGRRVHRETIDWDDIRTDIDLWIAMHH